jgi:hypothetical protein
VSVALRARQRLEPELDLLPDRGEVGDTDSLVRAEVLERRRTVAVDLDDERVAIHFFFLFFLTFTVADTASAQVAVWPKTARYRNVLLILFLNEKLPAASVLT